MLKNEQLNELRESFNFNDANGDGKIEFNEFVRMLDGFDALGSEAEARVGFDTIDTDGDGMIDFEEFVAWWNELSRGA